jgi:hypothetical protein
VIEVAQENRIRYFCKGAAIRVINACVLVVVDAEDAHWRKDTHANVLNDRLLTDPSASRKTPSPNGLLLCKGNSVKEWSTLSAGSYRIPRKLPGGTRHGEDGEAHQEAVDPQGVIDADGLVVVFCPFFWRSGWR